jgi:hypothetical protein
MKMIMDTTSEPTEEEQPKRNFFRSEVNPGYQWALLHGFENEDEDWRDIHDY